MGGENLLLQCRREAAFPSALPGSAVSRTYPSLVCRSLCAAVKTDT